MARASISLFLLVLATLGQAQAFGRFGYSESPVTPGFIFAGDGFRTKAPGADWIKFVKPITFQREETSPESASYSCGTFAGNPRAIKVNLRSPGFEMVCPYGLQLKFSTLVAPILTVSGASYGEGTPAPPAKWVLVTFSSKQPPLLLCFLDGSPRETIVEGVSGDWKLRTIGLYDGTVRVALPFGLDAVSANAVSTLGTMAKEVEEFEGSWTAASPKLMSTTYDSDESSITVRWSFDGPGALVPPSVILAKASGYRIKTLSPVFDTHHGTEEGPIAFAKTSDIELKFPLNRIPTGRSVTLGESTYSPPTQLPANLQSTVELALANMLASRSTETVVASEAALDEYFTKTAYAVEPVSGSRLPFASDGTGMDLAAANALLMQTLSLSQGHTQEPNSLMTSLGWRWDPMTMRFWTQDPQISRRAGCLTSLCAVLSQEQSTRAFGAMIEAGVKADESLEKYCQARGYPLPPPCGIDPMGALRDSVFDTSIDQSGRDAFSQSIMSDVRIVSDQALAVTSDGKETLATWKFAKGDKPEIILSISAPMKVVKVANIISLRSTESFGQLVIKYVPKSPGKCMIKLVRPGWTKPLPIAVPVPRYSETPR